MKNKQKSMLYEILISLSLFVVAIMISCFNFANSLKITNFCLIAAYLIAGYNIIFKTIKNLINFNLFDENFLMCVATLGAFYLNEHFEAVLIILLYQIGEFVQHLAITHSKNSISKLLKLKPQYVNLKTENGIVKTKPELVKIGSTIVVKPGEQIPLDGTIVSGTSQLNTASMTGEFNPTAAHPGNKVVSGYINLTSMLEIKIETIFQNSTLNKMLKLIENSKQKKATSEKFITKFAKIYTPIIVLTALAVAVIPTTFFSGNLQLWLQNAIVLLSISCPCALVISIPLSFSGAIASSAKNTILLKSSNTIEIISKIKTIIFDKTGTLTLGTFEVIEANPNNISEKELIKLLAIAESLTNHPIANAIKSKFPNSNFNNQISNFEEMPGLGVKVTTTNNDVIYAGNEQLMKKFKIVYNKSNSLGTIIYIAKNQTYFGNVVVSDKIKPEAKQTIQQLRKLKFKKIYMLTGDKKNVANKISNFLNLNSNFAEQMPHEKVNKIEELQKNNPLIFVGDGINDSPALATANVGIALMGKFGADITTHSADVVLVGGNLKKIVNLIKISKKTMNIIKQNIVFSISIKILILLASVFGLANIWLAVFSDVGVSSLAIANSLRALKKHH